MEFREVSSATVGHFAFGRVPDPGRQVVEHSLWAAISDRSRRLPFSDPGGGGRIRRMKTPVDLQTEPQWPGRLINMCAALRSAAEAERCELRAKVWNLLRDSLFTALRREAPRHRSVAREDLEDVASAKALDLLARSERGDWDLTNRSHGEVVNYIRSTARHGLIRLAQQNGRTISLDSLSATGGGDETEAPEWRSPMPAPDRFVESREFATGLVECLSRLQPRSQRIWFLRAVHEFSSREIARHPDVGVNSANVDVILMRVRAHLTDCLAVKGIDQRHLPAGTFTLLWDRVWQYNHNVESSAASVDS